MTLEAVVVRTVLPSVKDLVRKALTAYPGIGPSASASVVDGGLGWGERR